MSRPIDQIAELLLKALACDTKESSDTAASPPSFKQKERASQTSKLSSKRTRKHAA